MLDRVQQILQHDCHLDKIRPIILGVSGGADSLTLMDSFVKLDYQVVVAHFNHLLRPEAGDDAKVVEKVAADRMIPFYLKEDSAAEYAQINNLSIEEAARELRYRFLFDLAERLEAQAVAVAHNADDQVETVLMHLLRGSGLDGLTGMAFHSIPNPWSETIPLVRPLLHTWRTEIDRYCLENRISRLSDSTNADTTYFRNRIRHELLHELETYVPGFRKRLWLTAEVLRADRQILDEHTEKVWEKIGAKNERDHVAFILDALNVQSLGSKRRLFRRAISFLRPGARDVDFAIIQRALDFSSQPTATKQADLGLGLKISIEADRLIISNWHSDLPTPQWPQIDTEYTLELPGELDLGSGWILKAEFPPDVESAKVDAIKNQLPYQVWIDLGDRELMFQIRMRLPGDRFQPLGMDGRSMKISDFMVNRKIPRRARAGWPLICSGDEIAWVPGYQLGHSFQVTKYSRRIVTLIMKSR